jgi:hypothetical protein
MRAERGSKATAADVTKAIIIVRNMLITLGGHPPRDSPSRENIPTGFAPLCATTASRRLRFLAGRCLVARAKNGTPGIHGLQGDELRLLRALRREHPRADFVFLSEPPTRTRARILKVEGPQIGLLSATPRSGLSRVGRSPAVGKFPTMKSETKTKTKIRIGSGRGGARARPSPRRD